jgi:hypothetical protein
MLEKEEKLLNEELDKAINELNIKPKMSFEEACKVYNTISLEEFGKMWKESIRRIIPNP